MDESRIADLRVRRYNATISWMRRAHEELMILRVKPDHPVPAFKPGQYTALGLGYWERRVPDCQPETLTEAQKLTLVQRAFSISSPVLDNDGESLFPPEKEDFLEFYVNLVRFASEGDEAPPFTTRLFCLEEGDRIWISPKITGHYTLDGLPADRDALFCAAGTGEAPHNRMIWDLLRRGHRGRMASVVCCRYARDLAYRSVHERLTELYPPYAYVPMSTRDTPGPKRYIQDLILSGDLERATGLPLDPRRTHVYLCGNPAMIGIPLERDGREVYPTPRGVIEILETRYGFRGDRRGAPGDIHYEKFW